MRLFFQENEWALTSSWSGKLGDFFPPELTNVSNLGHPLFSRIAIPHVVLNFDDAAEKDVYRVPIDASHFHCAVIDYVSNGSSTVMKFWPPPGVDSELAGEAPERLSGGLSKTVYGHTAANDLSLWGSEYIRILYDLREAKLRARLNGGKDGTHNLRIELLFQFGPYSSEPAHEPSGMLNSARLIPAISFDTLSPHLRRLRFDIQCEPRLESLDSRLADVEFPAIALLTRDAEFVDPATAVPIGAARWATGTPYLEAGQQAVAAAGFAKIEKPLVYEICTTAWHPKAASVESPIVAGEGIPAWDNVHIAPGKRDGHDWVPELPSTPGAFYALHCHWRWGAMLGDFWYLYNNSGLKELFSVLFPFKPEIGRNAYSWFMDTYFHTLHPDGRDAQYRGLAMTANAGGPLFDPNLPVQTVQLLIAKTGHAQLGTTPAFDLVRDFRAAGRRAPEFINGGETLSWWLSFAAEHGRPADSRRSLVPFAGTLFASGMHFAHNLYEPGILGIFGPEGSLSALSRGRAAYYPPRAAQAWER